MVEPGIEKEQELESDLEGRVSLVLSCWKPILNVNISYVI